MLQLSKDEFKNILINIITIKMNEIEMDVCVICKSTFVENDMVECECPFDDCEAIWCETCFDYIEMPKGGRDDIIQMSAKCAQRQQKMTPEEWMIVVHQYTHR